MTAPHTPGTAVAQAVNVTFGGTPAKYHAVGIHDTNVAVAITGLVDADDSAINEANARRIAACLNAFDGLETEQVENMVNVPEFFFKHVELLAQRDELLTALNAAKQLFDEALPKFNWGASALDPKAIGLLNEVPRAVQAAIAKVGGAA